MGHRYPTLRSAALIVTAVAMLLLTGASGARPAGGITSARAAGSGRVVVVADNRYVPARVGSMARSELQDALGSMSALYRHEYPRTVRLVLAATPQQFAGASNTTSGDVLAVADPGSGTIVVSPRSWRGDPARMGSVLLHEASHMVLDSKFQAAGVAPPRWLTEGMAQYAANDWEFDLDWSAQQSQIMEGLAAAGKLAPIANLDTLFAGNHTDVQSAYAQSYSFIAFLANTYGRAELLEFIAAAAQPHATLDGAARKVYGRRLSQLQADWKDKLAQGPGWWGFLLGGSNFTILLWTLMALVVVMGFATITYRKRKAYGEMDDDGYDDDYDH